MGRATRPTSSTTTSSKKSEPTTSSSKPVEKPVSSSSSTKENTPTHNCDKDGHIWEEIYTKTEPKWHEEMHDVGGNGFDITLAKRYGMHTNRPIY